MSTMPSWQRSFCLPEQVVVAVVVARSPGAAVAAAALAGILVDLNR